MDSQKVQMLQALAAADMEAALKARLPEADKEWCRQQLALLKPPKKGWLSSLFGR